MNKELVLLVGPQGSGKTTLAKSYFSNYQWINQDQLGKENHLKEFTYSLKSEINIVVDRINHTKQQRARYLIPAKEAGYKTRIVV